MPEGILRISTDLLMQLLQLDDYKVKATRFSTFTDKVIEVRVEHESIPETKEGDLLPAVTPVYKKMDAALEGIEIWDGR